MKTVDLKEIALQFGESSKIIAIQDTAPIADVFRMIFGLPEDTPFLLQTRNETFGIWVDLEEQDYADLQSGCLIRGVMKPDTSLLSPPATKQADKIRSPDKKPTPTPETPLRRSPRKHAKTPTCTDQSWAENFVIPTEKFTQKLLDELADTQPKVLRYSLKQEFMSHICEKIFTYRKYPKPKQVGKIAVLIVNTYPCLRDQIGSGTDSWEDSIKNRLKNMRREMVDDVEVISHKRAKSSVPPPKPSEDPYNVQLKQLFGKIKDGEDVDITEINALMDKTFSERRTFLNHKHNVQDLVKEYPTLFLREQILLEFTRITGVHLTDQMETGLGEHCQKLIDMANKQPVGKLSSHAMLVLHEMNTLTQSLDADNVDLVKKATSLLVLPDLLCDQKDYMLKFYSEHESKQDILNESIANGIPYVAMIGLPMKATRYYIVSEGLVLFEGSSTSPSKSVLEAVSLLFSTFYITHRRYHKKVLSTFLFLQEKILCLPNDQKVPGKLCTFMKKLK